MQCGLESDNSSENESLESGIEDNIEVESESESSTKYSEESDNESDNQSIEKDGEDNIPLARCVTKDSRIIVPTKERLKGKNDHLWSTEPPLQSKRISKRNIIHFQPGSKGSAKEVIRPIDCFLHFFHNGIINKIVQHTNEEIQSKAEKYKKGATVSETCKEVLALIGLLIFSGAMKNNHLNARHMFNSVLPGSIYKSTMSCNRFLFLLDALKFDGRISRPERSRNDAFAPIREVWDTFIDKCKQSYTPTSYVTIDEQLLAFRGRCRFRMYTPNKLAEYGLKIVMVCDSTSKYMINVSPYLGKSKVTNGPLANYYVKSLTTTLHGSNRNITMDNWFTSVELADLLCDPYNLTLVGTIRKISAIFPLNF
ncbi:hypothetical protein NQ314_003282 [Rhamnusium bicolor]|uniref:PiggyBac transposable element-derived protein domain-containing protein n=1 Tax=Rhamnusium bicolor TaxID=1586634 RepID=A0AAV8ZME6_9CUCU|nr:hypothetical protein NQ314_003282 [Rhamnusium bicolor]